MDELAQELYRALQALFSCPCGCTVCAEHRDLVTTALRAYLTEWEHHERLARECEDCG